MSQPVINMIQKGLQKRYKNYRFNVVFDETTNLYTITVFKGVQNLGSQSYDNTMLLTDFWNAIQVWMVSLMSQFGI